MNILFSAVPNVLNMSDIFCLMAYKREKGDMEYICSWSITEKLFKETYFIESKVKVHMFWGAMSLWPCWLSHLSFYSFNLSLYGSHNQRKRKESFTIKNSIYLVLIFWTFLKNKHWRTSVIFCVCLLLE